MRSCRTLRRDHPRVCGEQARRLFGCSRRAGSSPRVRGTDLVNDGIGNLHGIIPACAGNRHGAREPTLLAWDHPRVCGEQALAEVEKNGIVGSSPRVRGTDLILDLAECRRGIIPACAGNSGGSWRRPSTRRDHPRVCGEQKHTNVSALLLRGIIPACAGNS